MSFNMFSYKDYFQDLMEKVKAKRRVCIITKYNNMCKLESKSSTARITSEIKELTEKRAKKILFTRAMKSKMS